MITLEQYERMIRVQENWLKKCARHRIEQETETLNKLKAEYEREKNEQCGISEDDREETR